MSISNKRKQAVGMGKKKYALTGTAVMLRWESPGFVGGLGVDI